MQFIDVEDKIFGPFSWRQFIYLIGGAGAAVVSFIMNKVAFVFIGLPLLALSLLLAFYPFNGRPFSFLLEAVFMYLKNKKIYFWRKNISKATVKYKPRKINSAYDNFSEKMNQVRTNKINELSRQLELNSLQKPEV